SRRSSFNLNERRQSIASAINVPGGFRREFIIKKVINNSNHNNPKSSKLTSNTNNSNDDITLPPFLTRNFMEFLSIYGHFAGENLEDYDFKTCAIKLPSKSIDEETPLLSESSSTNISSSAFNKQKGTATPLKAFFLLFKAFIGTGILFLPKAFLNGGLLFSSIVLFFFGLYSYWCYYLLVQTKSATNVSSFGDIGLILFGYKMKLLILFSIVLSQIGFVATYLVFTSNNLIAFIKNIFNFDVSFIFMLSILCLIFMPLSLIRNITKLSLAALFANVFIFFGLIVIVYYTSFHLILNGPANDIIFFNSNDWPLFIGVAIFSFEGIGLIIPIQESMAQPEKFPKVMFLVIVSISILMISIASLCYMTYGSKTLTVIILNLPQDSIFVNLIQLFYSLAILLSSPLQLFPVIKILENNIFGPNLHGKFDWKIKWLKNFFRFSIVILCTLIAIYGADNLDRFVSLVGCLACIPLVYMYPPMLHYKSCAKDKLARLSDICLVIFGGIALIYTTSHLL
ncbi:Avt4p ASCRUDRAFT_16472, partial [Ascoidea rubescens DSM 1968]